MNRGPRFLVPGVLVLAVLAGGCSTSSSGSSGRGPESTGTATGCEAAATAPCPAGPADVAVAGPPALVRVPSSRADSRAHQAGAKLSPSASSHASSSRAATPTGGAAGSPPAGSAASSAPASPPESTGGRAAGQVLALINQARAAAGRPALTVTAGLEDSSSDHNLRMADGCGLSHQCPGEPAIGARETAAGVGWTAAGENIGEGGPVANTTSAIAQLAVGLTRSMLNEQPPNDRHRQNILSGTFTHVGIAVYRDSAGTVWLTQDFSN